MSEEPERVDQLLEVVRQGIHDLNGALGLASGYAELVAEAPELSEETRGHVRELLNGLDRAAETAQALHRRLTSADRQAPG